MKYIIGNGQNLVEFTYVGNVAQAHLQVKLSAASFFVQEVSSEFTYVCNVAQAHLQGEAFGCFPFVYKRCLVNS